MSTPLHGLLIGADRARPVTLDGEHLAEQLCRQIGCDLFDVVHLEDGIDVFVDDEGLLVARPVLNLPLTVVAHALGTPAVLFGTGVVLGGDDHTGDTLGLSSMQRDRVLGAMRHKPSPEVLGQLCDSLAPFPGIVYLLRRSA